MNIRIRNLAAALMMFCALPAARAASPGVKLPAYKKLSLKNGVTVLLMEQHKVPLVSLTYIVKAGSTADPAGKEGLASLTANLLRKGTKTRGAEGVSESLDSVGARYHAWADQDCSGGSAEFMKKDIAGGLDLVADLLRNPVFPDAEVRKLAAQRIDGVKSAKDSAQGVIRNYFNGFRFAGHPYGRPGDGDEMSLAAITREDVLRFHETHYVPANLILALVGDFSTADMAKLVSERFGSWKSSARPDRAQMPAPKAVPGRRLLLVDKPDATQTYFMIGSLGVARDNPDRVAIDVVNVLFGGRFTSMINTALRIKSGLTYGAHSQFEKAKVPGPFFISSFTANATTERALDLALDTLHQLHEKGITEEELASAKAYIKGTLPPERLETSDQLANLLAEMQFYGLPDGEVNEFYAKVDAMTLADARRIIATYYPEKDLCFVLIGKASEIAPVAAKYAPRVKTKPIAEAGF